MNRTGSLSARIVIGIGIAALAFSSCGDKSNSMSPDGAPSGSASLTGVVSDATSNLPIAGAAVAVQGKSATTNTNGRYTLSGLPSGEVTVTVKHQGHSNVSQTVTLSGATTANITMTAAPEAVGAGSWGGQLRETPSGAPVPVGMTLSIDTVAQTVQASFTFGGPVLGLGTPPTQTFSAPYTTTGFSFTTTSSFFGTINVSASPGATLAALLHQAAYATTITFSGSITNVPGGQIQRIDFTCVATASTMSCTFTTRFNSGSTSAGSAGLTRGAPPGTPPSGGIGPVTISDRTFNLGDWESTSNVVGKARLDTRQQTGNGAEGTYHWVEQDHFSNASSMTAQHRYKGQSYDPQRSGAISSIDYSERRLEFFLSDHSGGGAGGVSAGFLVYQGGQVFTKGLTPLTASWQTQTATNLHASDFTSASGAHPDFSSAGGVIFFGFSRGTFAVEADEAEEESQGWHYGTDDFEVTINR